MITIAGIQFFGTGDVSLEEVLQEAAIRCPGQNIVEACLQASHALVLAQDPDVDLARREAYLKFSTEVVDLMKRLFNAAHARKQRTIRKAAKPRLRDRVAKDSAGAGAPVI
jgi:hypothetical protein